LCVGMQVVVISNIDRDAELYNGAKATVEDITSKRIKLWPGGR
jgi:hypothetical protein